jgi:radical SAM superfamily enzyme with C-terminal helix-hairpin-helix motif
LRVLIIDGYTDEPAGLGVPPYLDVYPRYIAGAVWKFDPTADVIYLTIDQTRQDRDTVKKVSTASDFSIVVAGVTVPGKYLGGAPATAGDVLRLPSLLQSKHTAICGPAAKFGFGRGGGSMAQVPREMNDLYEFSIAGDPEIVVTDLLQGSFAPTDTDAVRGSENEINGFAARGARIITQHPKFPAGLICEIETYRGCPRSLKGGCSFCTEPLHGTPDFRSVQGISREVAALYSYGAVNFRLGRQPDLLIYGSRDDNEYPAPNPSAIKRLFSALRRSAPSLKVLHIDNVSPATIYNHPDASEAALREIVSQHTPGDVAALGIESADEEVIRRNNLKVYPEGALLAISVINEVGGERGNNGLPHLLPGINFVYGLPGETRRTFEANLEFMKRVLGAGLLVRRINLRQVMVMPDTRLESFGDQLVHRHRSLFIKHKAAMRSEIDTPMLRRVAPEWTVLKGVRTELVEGNMTWSRQIGSYPILVGIPKVLPPDLSLDVIVLSHGPRSVSGLPYPIGINHIGMRELEALPGVGSRRAASLIRARPFRDPADLSARVKDSEFMDPLIRFLDFAP